MTDKPLPSILELTPLNETYRGDMLVPMLMVLSAMVVWTTIPLRLPGLIRPEFLK